VVVYPTTFEYLNSIGFNILDGYIYGLSYLTLEWSDPQIIKIAANGNYQFLGIPESLVATSISGHTYAKNEQMRAPYYTGDMDDNGSVSSSFLPSLASVASSDMVSRNLWIIGTDTAYKINIETMKFELYTLSKAFAASDWAFNPRDVCFYAMQNSVSEQTVIRTSPLFTQARNLDRYCPATGVVTTSAVTGDAWTTTAQGGSVIDAAGNFYAYANNGGVGNVASIYKVPPRHERTHTHTNAHTHKHVHSIPSSRLT
jgi:hypothetical protein